jgi:hypothetical protein
MLIYLRRFTLFELRVRLLAQLPTNLHTNILSVATAVRRLLRRYVHM